MFFILYTEDTCESDLNKPEMRMSGEGGSVKVVLFQFIKIARIFVYT